MKPITLGLAGDIMLAGELFEREIAAHGPEQLFDSELRERLATLDLVHADFEMCITAAPIEQAKMFHFRGGNECVQALSAARVRHVSLANNHTLDFGAAGLQDTIAALTTGGIACSGATGRAHSAREAAVVELKGARVGFLSAMFVPDDRAPELPLWTISPSRAIEELAALRGNVRAARAKGSDIVVFAGHLLGDFLPDWRVAPWVRELVHEIAGSGVDVVHLHGVHHILGIEFHGRTPILWGCGTLLDDYGDNLERISSYQRAFPDFFPPELRVVEVRGQAKATIDHPNYRNGIGLVAKVTLDPSGKVSPALELWPVMRQALRASSASAEAASWAASTLARTSPALAIELTKNETGAAIISARAQRARA